MNNSLINKIKMYGLARTVNYMYIELGYLLRRYFVGSYSQRAEDLFLAKQFPANHFGFYVDVGANNPYRFSNTCYFYTKGWRGINIEPDVKNYSEFVEHRPRDINLNIGINEIAGNLTYYRFSPHTLNTFSKEESDSYISQGYKLIETLEIPVVRLDSILEKYLPAGTDIDFMSIDTEGFDINVVKSADLHKYSPKYICIESVRHAMSGGKSINELDEILSQYGYIEIYNNGLNSIYKRS